ncbi:T9SS type A sorting domain-containing protein [Persicobacter diffluens]|uniref:Secretion system C-terminal sorting domain-containing protein n=1 Tax=Persicobacter diffluens TaxID=981 RepID=A0AAN4VZU1_9BACT|nr:hypothetical protein PEDI_22790 [Persicobacter diffluens]
MKKFSTLLLAFIIGHAVNAQRSLPNRNVRIAEALQQQITFTKQHAKVIYGNDSMAVQAELCRLDSLYREELRHWESINAPHLAQTKVKSDMLPDSTLSRVVDESTKKWINFGRSMFGYNDQDLLIQEQRDTLISPTESEVRNLNFFEYDQEGRRISQLYKVFNPETGTLEMRSKTEYKYSDNHPPITILHVYELNPENGQPYKVRQITSSEWYESTTERWYNSEWLYFNTEGDTIRGSRTTQAWSPLYTYYEHYNWDGEGWIAINKGRSEHDEDGNELSLTMWQSEGAHFTSSERHLNVYEEGKKTAHYRSNRAHDEDAWKHNHFTHYAYDQGDTLMVENNFDKEGEVWVQYAKSYEIRTEKGTDFRSCNIHNGNASFCRGTETTLDEMGRKIIAMDYYLEEGQKRPYSRHVYQYNGAEKQESEDLYQDWSKDTQQWLNRRKGIKSYDDHERNLLNESYNWSTSLNDWVGDTKTVLEYNEAGDEILNERYSYLRESQSWLLKAKTLKEIRNGFYSWESYQYDHDAKKLVGTHKSLTDSTKNNVSGNLEIYLRTNWRWDAGKDDWVLEYDERREYYTGTQSLKWVDYYDRQYPEWARNHRIKYYYRDFEEENDDVVLATDEAFGFQLMPNPATDYFRISGPAEVQELKIMNAAGQQVRTYPGGENQYFIGDLSAGVYHIVLTSGSKQAVFKLLKQ